MHACKWTVKIINQMCDDEFYPQKTNTEKCEFK